MRTVFIILFLLSLGLHWVSPSYAGRHDGNSRNEGSDYSSNYINSAESVNQKDARQVIVNELKEYQDQGINRLSKTDFPQLYSLIEEILVKFNRTLNTSPHSDGKVKNLEGVFILDAPSTDFCAFTIKPYSPSQAKNSYYGVFISTGFIKDYLFHHLTEENSHAPSERDRALVDGMKSLLGVLAHETAHHSAAYSSMKSHSSFNLGASQFEESRSDTVSLDFLRQNAFPRDSMILALHAVDKFNREQTERINEGLASAARVVSTHPSDTVRIMIGQEAATLDALKRGDYPVQELVGGSSALISHPAELREEIHRLPSRARLIQKNAPQNLAVAFSLSERTFSEIPQKIGGYYSPQRKCTIQNATRAFHWALFWMHESTSAASTYKERFLALSRDFFQKVEPIWWPELSSEECRPIEMIEKAPDISQLIESSEVLNTPEYFDAVTHSFYNTQRNEEKEKDFLKQAYQYLPLERRVSIFMNTFFPPQITFADRLISKNIEKLSKKTQIEWLKKVNGQLLEQVPARIQELNPTEFEEILLNKWANQTNFYPVLSRFLTLDFLKDETILREFMEDPVKKDKIKVLAQYLYNHRGILGAIELGNHVLQFADSKTYKAPPFYWSLVFQILDIPEEEGKSQLRSAVLRTLSDYESTYPTSPLSKGEIEDRPSPDWHHYSEYLPVLFKMPVLTAYFSNDQRTDSENIRKNINSRNPSGDPSHSPLYWDGPEVGQFLLEQFRKLENSESGSPSWTLRSTGIYRDAFIGLPSLQEKILAEFQKDLIQQLRERGTDLEHSPELLPQLIVEIWHRTVQSRMPWRRDLFPYAFPAALSQNESNSVFSEDLHLNLMLTQWVQEHVPLASRKAVFEELLRNHQANSCMPLSKDFEEIRNIMKNSHVLENFSEFTSFLLHSKDRLFSYQCITLNKNGAPNSGWGDSRQDIFLKDLDMKLDHLTSEELSKTLLQPSINRNLIFEKFSPYLNPARPGGPERERYYDADLKYSDKILSIHSLMKTKKLLVDYLLPLSETEEEWIQSFELLTAAGSTPDTDRYLHTRLLQHRQKTKPYFSEKVLNKFKEWITPIQNPSSNESHKPSPFDTTRIGSEALRQSLFEYELDTFTGDLETVKARLFTVFPQASLNRDQILENIAWKMKIDTNEALQKEITSNKFTGSPKTILAMSTASEACGKVTPNERAHILLYITHPSLETKSNYRLVFEEHPELKNLGMATGRWTQGRETDNIYKFLDELSVRPDPNEKIPVIDLLLNCKSEAHPQTLLEDPQEMNLLLQQQLGYTYESPRGQVLKAYLKAVPTYEQSAIYSYLFSHSRDSSNRVKSLFEVFSTVGIKAGQLASLLDLFENPEVKLELSQLKDHAPSLDKVDVLKALRENLSPEQYDKIHRVSRILGCASIKCVYELENKDGTHSVAVIRRPYAIPVARENIKRAERFIAELKKIPEFASKARMLENIFHTSKMELENELDLERDQERVQTAGVHFGTSAQPFLCSRGGRADLGLEGWTMQVPQYLSNLTSSANSASTPSTVGAAAGAGEPSARSEDAESKTQVKLMEFANGVSFDSITDPTLRAAAGKAIVIEATSTLLSSGFMNSDPHKGNFIIDPERKIIYPIDFGQSTQLNVREGEITSDDRAQLINFLLSLGLKKKAGILAHGLSLTQEKRPTRTQKTELERRINEATTMEEILQAFFLSGLSFSPKYFGILKGISTLEKEKYVSDQSTLMSLISKVAQEKIGFRNTFRFLGSVTNPPDVECLPDPILIDREINDALTGAAGSCLN